MNVSTVAASRTSRIAELNDRVREGSDPTARILITRACLATFCGGDTAAGLLAQAGLMAAVRATEFTADCPERDFAELSFRGERVFLKVDYYDETLTWGSEDPADPARTVRVLTVMMPEDL
ncbi:MULTISPECIES: DUF3768 domain-containing protein [unclassified Sphingomonas]|uniref:DUF3768 domain-containing protein n=1 Tax=unclassified Sphingomonas TaxID=196159 RepID=UPI000927BE13|nr:MULTISPECIES: DUF3768 domain-containing protein [unclassified Sphingomonas]MBN8847370.1 DUF3768 domain-containing protein [Sphingomonas sp.]OJV28222.1 MAG: hypothetical protein BGO24_07780 [Sphingomonas sp. 67-36]